jgi:hypothetical protein
MPAHSHILDDLRLKKNENEDLYNELQSRIDSLFHCEEPIYENLKFDTGYPTDLVLKTLKWLFIEQDIRDWSYSGRQMLYDAISAI